MKKAKPQRTAPRPTNTAVARLAKRIARCLPFATLGQLWDTQADLRVEQEAFLRLHSDMMRAMRSHMVPIFPQPRGADAWISHDKFDPVLSVRIEFEPFQYHVMDASIGKKIVTLSPETKAITHRAARDMSYAFAEHLAETIERVTLMKLGAIPWEKEIRPRFPR